MIDERRQAALLREQLDRELTGVRATALARQRLRIRASRSSSAGRRLLRPAIAAVAVLVVVAVPVLIRSGTSPELQPAKVPPAGSTTTPVPSLVRPTRVPTARPVASPSTARDPRTSVAATASRMEERRSGPSTAPVSVRPTSVVPVETSSR
jgi:hypothetical protein